MPRLCPDVDHAAAEDEDEDEEDGKGKGLLSTANAMFDSVWCPLPTWVRVLLVIAVSAEIVLL